MVRMLRTLADDESLSMSVYNVWWLAGHALTVGYAALRGSSVSAAMTAPATYVAFDRVAAHGLPYLRAAGCCSHWPASDGGLWIRTPRVGFLSRIGRGRFCRLLVRHARDARARKPRLPRYSAARGGLGGTQAIHARAGGGQRLVHAEHRVLRHHRRRPVRRPRWFTVIDATLIVGVLGCVSLAWFAKALSAECSIVSSGRLQPAVVVRLKPDATVTTGPLVESTLEAAPRRPRRSCAPAPTHAAGTAVRLVRVPRSAGSRSSIVRNVTPVAGVRNGADDSTEGAAAPLGVPLWIPDDRRARPSTTLRPARCPAFRRCSGTRRPRTRRALAVVGGPEDARAPRAVTGCAAAPARIA